MGCDYREFRPCSAAPGVCQGLYYLRIPGRIIAPSEISCKARQLSICVIQIKKYFAWLRLVGCRREIPELTICMY